LLEKHHTIRDEASDVAGIAVAAEHDIIPTSNSQSATAAPTLTASKIQKFGRQPRGARATAPLRLQRRQLG
jgi:hypothetical protein